MREGMRPGQEQGGENETHDDLGFFVGEQKDNLDRTVEQQLFHETAPLQVFEEYTQRIADRKLSDIEIPNFDSLSRKEKMEAMYKMSQQFVSEFEVARYVYHHIVDKKQQESPDELNLKMKSLFSGNYETNPHCLDVQLSTNASLKDDTAHYTAEEVKQLYNKMFMVADRLKETYSCLGELYANRVEQEYEAAA